MKKNRITAWLLFILVPLLISCMQSGNKQYYNAGTGQILVPPKLEIYNSKLTMEAFKAGSKGVPLKLFTNVNVSCATCVLKLESWEKFRIDASACAEILIVPVCTSKDKFEMIKFLFESKKVKDINFPLLLDSGFLFTDINNKLFKNSPGASFLTDSDNIVLVSGNPIDEEADRKKFMDLICKKKQR